MSDLIDYFNSYVDLSSKIYWLLYEGAPYIVWWFITPLVETSNEPIISQFVGDMSPLELTFGVGIVMVLIAGVVKYFTSMTPL